MSAGQEILNQACKVTGSWKSCGKKKQFVECSLGTEACMEKTATLKNGYKEYSRGCVPKKQCRKDESDCKSGVKQNCEIHCCEEKHCRGMSGGTHRIAGGYALFVLLSICLLVLLQY